MEERDPIPQQGDPVQSISAPGECSQGSTVPLWTVGGQRLSLLLLGSACGLCVEAGVQRGAIVVGSQIFSLSENAEE